MANDTVTVRNKTTGQVGTYSRRIFNNPRIMNPDVFEEVDAGTKPYAKKTYKPRKPKENIEPEVPVATGDEMNEE